MDRESILRMAQGAIEEKVDYEVGRVIDNITDPNVKATGKRKIVVTLEFVPDDERTRISLNASVKTTLCAINPATTQLLITSGEQGEMVVAEMVPQIPGQINMDGGEQSKPKTLKLVAQD